MSNSDLNTNPVEESSEIIAGDIMHSEGPGSHRRVINGLLAIVSVTLFALAMFASYSAALGNPALRSVSIAVQAPAAVVDGLRSHAQIHVTTEATDDAAQTAVRTRAQAGAIVVSDPKTVTVYIAYGGGISTARSIAGIGNNVAAQLGATATVTDLAPLAPDDPNGTIEFYAIVFVTVAAGLGATILGRVFGTVRNPEGFIERTLFLVLQALVLAGVMTVFADFVFNANTQQPWGEFGILALLAMCVGGAITGVGAAVGTIGSLALTLGFTVLGNPSSGGPVGEPLLPGFFAALAPVVPQGGAMSAIRSILYFNGNGALPGLLDLVAWGILGILGAFIAMYRRYLHRADDAGRHSITLDVAASKPAITA